MDLHVALTRRGRLSADVYAQVRAAILAGHLAPGARLPASRELATRLSIARNTVLHAYGRLVAEGFAVGRAGGGTFVADEVAIRPSAPIARGSTLTAPLAWLGRVPLPPTTQVRYDLQLGIADPSTFPWDTWRWYVARQLRGRRSAAGYPEYQGEPRLRAALASHLALSRGVRVAQDDLLITAGAQQAFGLLARVWLRPGDVAVVEEPSYPPLVAALRLAGARVVPVPVDRDGLVVDALPARARLVCVTPSHQFPLGVPMTLARRLALLNWADRAGAAIIEDDYDSELRHSGRPIDPLHTLDRSGRVLYVGTFSKVLAPWLRLGYVVAPPSLMPTLTAARALDDGGGATDVQRALAEFIADGHLARHVRRVLRRYGARRERLDEAIARHLGGEVEVMPSVAGLHRTVLFRDPRVDAVAVAARVERDGVRVVPLARYAVGRRRLAGLAFGLGLIADEDIEPAMRAVGAAVGELRPAPGASISSARRAGRASPRRARRRGSGRSAAPRRADRAARRSS